MLRDARIPRALLGTLAAAALLAAAVPARAQATIKVNDDVNFRLGMIGQFQADTTANPDDSSTNNLFIRRLRLMFGGQVAKHVTFFIETDAPNLGKVLPGGKNIQPSMILQDAYAEVSASPDFMLDAGLLYVPFSRNYLQSSVSLVPIDYGAFTFAQSGATESVTGRDTGFQARGYLANQHFEYRVAALQGARDSRSSNGFRYAGRAQYNFFDTETAYFYTGTYLGKKRIFGVGGGFDTQQNYHAYDADTFVDLPYGPGSFTGQIDFNHFDGGTTLTTLPKQNDVLIEAGYLIAALKLTPVLQVARRNMADTSTGDETHTSIGLDYWWAGYNANVKVAYGRITAPGRSGSNELTVQLQLFYY